MIYPTHYVGRCRLTSRDGWDTLWITVPVETIAGPMLGEVAVWCATPTR